MPKKKSTKKPATKKENMTSDLNTLIPSGNRIHRPGAKPRNSNPKPKSKDPWDSIKSRKKHPVLEPVGLFEFFREEVRANLIAPNIIFNPKVAESLVASEILDVLIMNHCEDEATARSWVIWYVKEHIKGRTFISYDVLKMKSMLGTWDRFAIVRPAIVAKPEKKEVKKINLPLRTIRQELDTSLGKNPESGKVEKSLYLFGISIVANYLRGSMEPKPIVDLIGSILDKIHNSFNGKNDIQLVYNASSRYSIARSDILLSGWRGRYEAHWNKAGCIDARHDDYYMKRAEEFFKDV